MVNDPVILDCCRVRYPVRAWTGQPDWSTSSPTVTLRPDGSPESLATTLPISGRDHAGCLKTDHRIVVLGAGSAAIGVADMISTALVDEGLTQQQAADRFPARAGGGRAGGRCRAGGGGPVSPGRQGSRRMGRQARDLVVISRRRHADDHRSRACAVATSTPAEHDDLRDPGTCNRPVTVTLRRRARPAVVVRGRREEDALDRRARQPRSPTESGHRSAATHPCRAGWRPPHGSPPSTPPPRPAHLRRLHRTAGSACRPAPAF